MTDKTIPQDNDDVRGGKADSNRPDSGNQRRKVLKSTLAGGAAITASVVPDKWTRPAVDSVMLPAHAATTGDGGDPGTGTTAAPVTTLPPAEEEPLPGSYFGPVPRFELDFPVARNGVGEAASLALIDRVAGFLAPNARAGVPEDADLCVEMLTPTQVRATYVMYVEGLPLDFKAGSDQQSSIPTFSGYLVWQGEGTLGIGFKLSNDCNFGSYVFTITNPTVANITWAAEGNGSTIDANPCNLKTGSCPNYT